MREQLRTTVCQKPFHHYYGRIATSIRCQASRSSLTRLQTDASSENFEVQKMVITPLIICITHEGSVSINRAARDAADALERRGVVAGPSRVQAGARAPQRDPTRGVVQLIVTDALADIVRLASYTVRR